MSHVHQAGCSSGVTGSALGLWRRLRRACANQDWDVPNKLTYRMLLGNAGKACFALEVVKTIRCTAEDSEDSEDGDVERHITRLEQTRVKAHGVWPPPAFPSHSWFLISGGCGGLGIATAGWLVTQGVTHLALLSRTGKCQQDGPESADLQRLCSETGVQVLLHACDITSQAQVDSTLQTMRAFQDVPVKGVVHAAGLLEDHVIAHMERSHLQPVLSPKMDGAVNLHAALSGTSLDQFLMFSSVAALLGSPGQGNYAAANSFLDCFAQYRQAKGLPALSLQWGPWAEVGMAARGGVGGPGFWAPKIAAADALKESREHRDCVPWKVDLVSSAKTNLPCICQRAEISLEKRSGGLDAGFEVVREVSNVDCHQILGFRAVIGDGPKLSEFGERRSATCTRAAGAPDMMKIMWRVALAPHVVALCTLFVTTWQFFRQKRASCPPVPGYWLLGNLPRFLRAALSNRHLDMFVEDHKELGDTIVYKFPFKPEVIDTTSPRNIEHMLKGNFANFVKGWWFRAPLTQLLGDGIFNADGALWHMQRKTASRMFTAQRFKDHIWRVVEKNSIKVQSLLGNAADTQENVDVFRLMNRFTLDTIGEIGFGTDIGSLDDPSSPFLASFDHAQKASFYRFVLPGPIWRLLRLLGVGSERGSTLHFRLLDDYSREVARDLSASLEISGGFAGASFVGLFLQDAASKGEDISEDFLRDLVLNFLIAGRDTTAQALAWTVFCISGHPDVEQRIVEELDSVVVDKVEGTLTYQKVSQLPFLQAVVSEALRLYPSVPFDSKVAINDDTLPDGTFVPGGAVVQFNPFAMARDTSLWGPDAAKFRPQRWLDMEAPPSSYEYAVFNAGPRECLGKRLAYLELKACLAHMFHNFTVELAIPREEVLPQSSLTIGFLESFV
ncbi:Cytochrome P450 86B1 [Durusdinium trenchii]|uniref:Cytochrome P450 86B1 n=1 Tax=Durusdinium trenchii TaxID=1381693 RepID=A0ABP0KHF8_9DINO